MAKKTNVAFGKILFDARTALDMTQAEAAADTGLNVSTLLRMEQGQPCNPSMRTLTRICEAYELDIGELAATWVDSEGE